MNIDNVFIKCVDEEQLNDEQKEKVKKIVEAEFEAWKRINKSLIDDLNKAVKDANLDIEYIPNSYILNKPIEESICDGSYYIDDNKYLVIVISAWIENSYTLYSSSVPITEEYIMNCPYEDIKNAMKAFYDSENIEQFFSIKVSKELSSEIDCLGTVLKNEFMSKYKDTIEIITEEVSKFGKCDIIYDVKNSGILAGQRGDYTLGLEVFIDLCIGKHINPENPDGSLHDWILIPVYGTVYKNKISIPDKVIYPDYYSNRLKEAIESIYK